MKEVTISNCFVHTNIIGPIKNAELRQLHQNMTGTEDVIEEKETESLIQDLHLVNSLTVEEYVNIRGENGKL